MKAWQNFEHACVTNKLFLVYHQGTAIGVVRKWLARHGISTRRYRHRPLSATLNYQQLPQTAAPPANTHRNEPPSGGLPIPGILHTDRFMWQTLLL